MSPAGWSVIGPLGHLDVHVSRPGSDTRWTTGNKVRDGGTRPVQVSPDCLIELD
jgi:hypothetical protein